MKHYIILFYGWILNGFRNILLFSDTTLQLNFIPGFNKLRTFNGSAKAYLEFNRAKKSVPAYSDFLNSKGFLKPNFNGMTPNIFEIPFTEKENYVKLFSIDERCVNGKMPTKGVILDESSGSSGTATNWARGKKERAVNTRMIQFGIRSLFGNDPLFVINAFALGPWATGVNVTMSCVAESKLKSIGPDKIKIENTIKQFGKDQKYIIMGYPPFLKMMVDTAEIDWKDYDVSFVFGGESMSEAMRDYLLSKGIQEIYSSYGASDIELNIAAENEFTISLRKLLNKNDLLRAKLLKHSGALPMVFQYNPADFLIETSDLGELIITVCRPNYIAPKIRYNIHDKGQIVSLKEIYAVLKELNIDKNKLLKPTTDLPILIHYGRSDMTVSFFGANISPLDIQETICNLPEWVGVINSFCMETIEDEDANKIFKIALEINSKGKTPTNLEQIKIDFFEQLATINQDFREAKKMMANDNQLILSFFDFATGPFENSDIRIKAKYIS
jgi:phenylacetate-CoA ligase